MRLIHDMHTHTHTHTGRYVESGRDTNHWVPQTQVSVECAPTVWDFHRTRKLRTSRRWLRPAICLIKASIVSISRTQSNSEKLAFNGEGEGERWTFLTEVARCQIVKFKGKIVGQRGVWEVDLLGNRKNSYLQLCPVQIFSKVLSKKIRRK